MSQILNTDAIMSKVIDSAKQKAIAIAENYLAQLKYEFTVHSSVFGSNIPQVEADSITYSLVDKGNGQLSFIFDLSKLSENTKQLVELYKQNARKKINA